MKEMQIVDIKEPGGPEVLRLSHAPIPEKPEGSVLIKVHAASVNFPDLLQRQGVYPPPPGASPILGLDVSGEVVEGFRQFSPGDKVCALVNGGGYAEYVTVPETQCLPVPSSLTFEQAASLPEVYFTVWFNVFMKAKLSREEHFLVHGGGGGIGSAAIQLAKAFGATVYTTCGSEEHCEFAKNLGADVTINYTHEDFASVITTGLDVILDQMGGDYFAKHLDLLKKDGRLISIAARRGYLVNLDILKMMLKRINVTGSALRPMTSDEKGQIAADLKKHVWPLFEKNEIRPVVTKVFNFKDVVEAHRHLESKHMGKAVLVW